MSIEVKEITDVCEFFPYGPLMWEEAKKIEPYTTIRLRDFILSYDQFSTFFVYESKQGELLGDLLGMLIVTRFGRKCQIILNHATTPDAVKALTNRFIQYIKENRIKTIEADVISTGDTLTKVGFHPIYTRFSIDSKTFIEGGK